MYVFANQKPANPYKRMRNALLLGVGLVLWGGVALFTALAVTMHSDGWGVLGVIVGMVAMVYTGLGIVQAVTTLNKRAEEWEWHQENERSRY